MNNKQNLLWMILALFMVISCSEKETPAIGGRPDEIPESAEQLSIFFFNDQHGQIDNFGKIKVIIDEAKANGNALLVCAGDAFSGNPIVDQFEERGLPMIDLMNQVGVDVAAVGNHEFDYGQETLTKRMNQSQFPWICANVDMGETGVPQPEDFVNLEVGGLKITFLSLLETNGKDNEIPSTHPWRVEGMTFTNHTSVVSNFQDLKEQENSDLLIALTHLGSTADLSLASNHNFIDTVIGGHSHEVIDDVRGGIPVVQAGDDLLRLGRMDLTVFAGGILSSDVTFINLNNNDLATDATIQTAIDAYNSAPEFSEVVGSAISDHSREEIGCFYTNALKEYMEVDFSIQNAGGIRAEINQGPITRLEIFEMDPFNNGSVIFTKTVGDYKDFFCTDGGWYTISGVVIEEGTGSIRMFMADGMELADGEEIRIGMNDFIPANNPEFFPIADAEIRKLTTAETVLRYLSEVNGTVDFEGCDNFFRCD
ncbi:MAG: bifunctional UDP-sugar hydrolase/5'-nucleotidase [Cytophagales bacterium]|nr:bifunctional UDP-sugar hydrolase/5'-nucleotidase [Cytophagales bacterium]